ncbi:MAG: ubiquinol-cytochrome c reductase iron-sulfur subunit [Chloroflexota bacterium]|nr:ubiquinol-cytochrome c reductase iron-sulfur subunit [Chloroflexota bacterium]
MNRRGFLGRLTVALGGAIAVALGVPVIGYVLAPLFARSSDEYVDVGALADFKAGATTLARIADPAPLPWAGRTGQAAIWVRRLSEASFVVFAENCTHLGCPVMWRPAAELFFCPCHGGVFYPDGRVAGGPPTRPLLEREWKIVGGRLLVRGTSLPNVPTS